MTLNNELNRLGMSQRSLSVLTGIPEETINLYCKGKKEFTSLDKQIISKALDINIDTLTQPIFLKNTYYKVVSSDGNNYSNEIFSSIKKAKEFLKTKSNFDLIAKITFHGWVENGIMMKSERTQEVVEIVR